MLYYNTFKGATYKEVANYLIKRFSIYFDGLIVKNKLINLKAK